MIEPVETSNMLDIPNDEYLSLDEILKSKNVAELLDDVALQHIAQEVVLGYEIDEDSRAEWKERLEKAMAIYNQNIEPKTEPWEGASNIKYPLIAEAAIGYTSATLPELIKNDRIVKTVVTGHDPQGINLIRSENTAKYVSYQLLVESDDWQDGLDHSLQMLSIQGILFKKTHYCPIAEEIRSEICVPDYICVNYATKSLNKAPRITHILFMRQNDIIERQRSGIFCQDVDLNKLLPDYRIENNNTSDSRDSDYEIELLEQHCWLDLDGDGYREPYIVTVHRPTQTVLRIVQRIDKVYRVTEGRNKGKVKKITAENYFTDYHFIRSGDGGYYSTGFGLLLYPLNASINTLMNQLIDAGTLSVTQGGFIGRGLRIRNGNFSVKMGEWKVVDAASGTNLKEQIVPLPVREPSEVLFKLLDLMMKIGSNLAATTDAVRGQENVQNVAQGTISLMVDQGTRFFRAINKRYYRSLQKELKRIFILNSKYLTKTKYQEVLQDPTVDPKVDFDMSTLTVFPVADPDMSSESKRLNRAIVIQQLRTVSPIAADRYMLKDVMGLEDALIKQLQPPPDPNAPPPPDVIEAQAKADKLRADMATQMEEMRLENNRFQLEMAKVQQAMKESESRIQESLARQVKMAKDAAHGEAKVLIAGQKMSNQSQLSEDKLQLQMAETAANTMLSSRQQSLEEARLVAEVQRTQQEAHEKAEKDEEGEDV